MDALRLDLLAFLEAAPRKERKKYGKRKTLSVSERSEIARQRNREHAKATRERRKVFAQIIEKNIEQLDVQVLKFLENSSDFKSAVTSRHRKINLESFFNLSDTKVSGSEDLWSQILLHGAKFASTTIFQGKVVVGESSGYLQYSHFMTWLLKIARSSLPSVILSRLQLTWTQSDIVASSSEHNFSVIVEVAAPHNSLIVFQSSDSSISLRQVEVDKASWRISSIAVNLDLDKFITFLGDQISTKKHNSSCVKQTF